MHCVDIFHIVSPAGIQIAAMFSSCLIASRIFFGWVCTSPVPFSVALRLLLPPGVGRGDLPLPIHFLILSLWLGIVIKLVQVQVKLSVIIIHMFCTKFTVNCSLSAPHAPYEMHMLNATGASYSNVCALSCIKPVFMIYLLDICRGTLVLFA